MTKQYFFTSDLHLSHTRIIELCDRPFANADEMNDEIIERYNSVVGRNDVCYILGDVSFEKDPVKLDSMLARLNGEKHIVWGNHDHLLQKNSYWRKYFATAQDLSLITVPESANDGKKQSIVLCHYAMRVWNKSHYGTWQLFGHSHGSLADDPSLLSCDVGVDSWDYYPVSMQQLNELMSKKVFTPVDHHRKR